MKRFIILITLCTLICTYTLSQPRLGVKAGVNLSGVTFSSGDFKDNNVTGFQIGPSLEWLFIGNLGFDASILYSQKGIKFVNGQNTNETKLGYLDVPANLKFRLPVTEVIKPFVAAGPYISFKINGNKSFSGMSSEIEDQWKAKNFAAGLNLGAGIELFRTLQVGFNYGMGITDNYNTLNGDYKAKEKTWSFTAGLFF